MQSATFLWTPGAAEEYPVPSPAEGVPGGAVRAPLPAWIGPMLAEAGPIFSHPDWWFELKWDGWRAITYADSSSLRVLSRRGGSLIAQFPELGEVKRAVRAEQFVLDGEIVALDEQGIPDFQRLQRRLRTPRHGRRRGEVTYYVFDLLYIDGWDLRCVPLEDRKARLVEVVDVNALVRVSDHVVGEGEQLFKKVEERALEGVMAKHRRAPYVSRRHPSWLKLKRVQTVDCVVVGMTRGERAGFGALVLGMYEGPDLVHVGSVGSGFNERTLTDVYRDLEGLKCNTCPLRSIPDLDDPVVWVHPHRVCEVRFGQWTDYSTLRFPVFVRMRADKTPRECALDANGQGAIEATRSTCVPLLGENTGSNERVDVDGVELQLTNLQKTYFPADGITKRDLINYYDAVSHLLLPHLADRPLTLLRYPEGIEGEHFFQRHGHQLPEWVPRVDIENVDGGRVVGVLCNDRPTLIYLVNLGCIDHNPQQSRFVTPDQPDWLLLDLDPHDDSFDNVVVVACLLHGLLERLGLRGWPKTTGGRGMHIYVPLAEGANFEQCRMLAQLLARVAEARRPDLVTLERLVHKREPDRVYIDYPQSGRGRSISAPYAVRPRPGAPVATPLEWEEVRPGLSPLDFTLRTVLPRFSRKGDIFAPVLHGGQDITAAIARIDSLLR